MPAPRSWETLPLITRCLELHIRRIKSLLAETCLHAEKEITLVVLALDSNEQDRLV